MAVLQLATAPHAAHTVSAVAAQADTWYCPAAQAVHGWQVPEKYDPAAQSLWIVTLVACAVLAGLPSPSMYATVTVNTPIRLVALRGTMNVPDRLFVGSGHVQAAPSPVRVNVTAAVLAATGKL